VHLNRRKFLMAALAAPAVSVAQKSPAPLFDRPFAQVSRVADGVCVTIAAPGGPRCPVPTTRSSPAATPR
jgi:hypothetical protein